jgi:tRNA(Ile)-lysidine synthase
MNWIQINPRLLGSFPPDARYLIGVSGGRDSVALLHRLVEAGYKNLVVCHLNHSLRGRSSVADARFVKKLAAKYHVDFELGLVKVRTLARRKKLSIETAGRGARYSFFTQIAKRRRCRTIFLAHHADDLVETFLINLSRGAGLSGLAAMREVSTRSIDGVDLTILRPLVSVWRANINAYVRRNRLKFREDESNKDLGPLRNRIRRRVIPNLEKLLGFSISQNIWRTATIIAEEENWIDTQARISLQNTRDLSVKELRALPVALQRRQILKWLHSQKIADIGFDVIERIRSLLDPAAQFAKVNLSRDQHARRRAGKIFLE